MKLLVFVGGSGKRFWPIGRNSKPKQFLKLFNNKSTFELTIERIAPLYGLKNIYVSTVEAYVKEILDLNPDLLETNVFTEPARRDVGPAVGLALMRLKKIGVNEPVAILWADHYIENVTSFRKLLVQAENLVLENKHKVVLVGTTPEFPATNLGWIQVQELSQRSSFSNEIKLYAFKDFVYRPSLDLATKLFKNKTGLWNTAYMISTIDTLLGFYKTFYPGIYEPLEEIYKYLGTPSEKTVLAEIYPEISKVHFDHIVSYHLDPESTVVLGADMGWSDPGTLYSYKRLFKPNKENFIQGNVFSEDVSDSLLINYESKKLVVVAFFDKVVVVNTKDALLVIPADKVKEIGAIYDLLKHDPKFSKYIE